MWFRLLNSRNFVFAVCDVFQHCLDWPVMLAAQVTGLVINHSRRLELEELLFYNRQKLATKGTDESINM